MTLIIETGAGIPGANTYVSIATATAYLDSKGLTTWGDAATGQETSLIQAALYMELLPYRGQRALSTDTLAWPRRGMQDRDGYPINSDVIPTALKYAQAELAFRFMAGKNPLADISSGDGYITSESVGPVTTEYSTGYSTSDKFPEVSALLEPFLLNAHGIPVDRC